MNRNKTLALPLVLACLAGSLATIAMGCGKSSKGSAEASLVPLEAPRPSDSTGKKSKVTLKFSRAVSGMSLAEEAAATSVDAGGGVVLSDARITMALVRLKTDQVSTPEEEAFEETLDQAAEKEGDEVDAADTAQEAAEPSSMDLEEADRGSDDETDTKEEQETELAFEKENDGSVAWQGPFVFDAIKGAFTTALPDAELLDGTYKRLEFVTIPNVSLPASDPASKLSVYMKGTVSLGGALVPFELRYDGEEDFSVAGKGGITVKPGVGNAILVVMDPVDWFKGVDMSKAKKDAKGTIAIDGKSNPEILEAILENVSGAMQAGDDDDKDGELDASEVGAEGVEITELEDKDGV